MCPQLEKKTFCDKMRGNVQNMATLFLLNVGREKKSEVFVFQGTLGGTLFSKFALDSMG